jgi:hypothetical protein
MGDAYAASHNCPPVLGASESCSVSVTLSPMAAAEYLGTVSLLCTQLWLNGPSGATQKFLNNPRRCSQISPLLRMYGNCGQTFRYIDQPNSPHSLTPLSYISVPEFNLNMSEYTLFPGPNLERKAWAYNDATKKGAWVTTSVTDCAAECLFKEVETDPQVTLADIFKLVANDPVMQVVFRQDFVQELCEEAEKGPQPPKNESADQRLEYLELYQRWNLNSSTGELSEVGRYQLHGIGVELESDVYDGDYLMYSAGTRIQWGVSLSPVRELLHLPVRVKNEVLVCEDDLDAKMYGKAIARHINKRITLGTFIREVLWELSWHGTPGETEELADSLRTQSEEIKAGIQETIFAEDVFESLGFLSTGIVHALIFDGSAAFDSSDIYRIVQEIPDSGLAAETLKTVFGGGLTLKSEHANLTGHALRKLIRETRHQDVKAEL